MGAEGGCAQQRRQAVTRQDKVQRGVLGQMLQTRAHVARQARYFAIARLHVAQRADVKPENDLATVEYSDRVSVRIRAGVGVRVRELQSTGAG